MHTHAATQAGSGRVVVVGGGLAGLTAAVRLAEAGREVTLLETRKRLGGRATSFIDSHTGELLDNCQHVVMRCCTHLLGLYRRLGVADRIQWHRTLYFVDRSGQTDPLVPDEVPAPAHLLGPMLKLGYLTAGEKWAVLRGMLALMRVDRRRRQAMDNETFAHWLMRHRQPAGAVRKFWSVVVTSACNERVDRIAAPHAIQVFQEGFLCHPRAYEVGLSTVPLVELYDAAADRLRQAGGEVRLGTSAEQFLFEQGQVTGVRLRSGEVIRGGAYISAVPPDRLNRLATTAMAAADTRLTRLDEWGTSPILGIHLFFQSSEPVTDLPHLALIDSPLHWIFNKSYHRREAVHHLHGVISAAHDLIEHNAPALAELATAEVRRVLPQARQARLVRHRVIKEKRATVSLRPGTAFLRPSVAGPIPNLYLAGDWVDTGWPATMEGAVRSGGAAADALLGAAQPTTGLEAGLLYRLLAG